jgi:dihydroorotase
MVENSRISIRHGRLIDPANGIDGLLDLHIAEGRVLAVGDAPAGFTPDRVLDANDQVVCPGLVDLCARLREPGQEHKGTIASETAAAAAAGITTLCCPPDTWPVIDTPAVAQLISQTAERVGRARVVPAGALTQGLDGQQISEMVALSQAGCAVMSQADRPILNTLVLRRAMEYAATFGLGVFLRPQDPFLRDNGCAHEGQVSARLGLPGIPAAAETVALARDLALAEQTGARVHFRGLSCARSLEMLAEAKQRHIAVTADVGVHQLFLTEEDLEGFDSQCHLDPPLRTAADRAALRDAVRDGLVTAVCSDHQPHEADAKLAPFPGTAPGMAALETLLPLMLRLVAKDLLDLPTAIARLTSGPAAILGLPLGDLATGRVADVCVFDPQARWRVGPDAWLSQGRNTPFLGARMKGRVRWTLLGGRVVHEYPSRAHHE